MSKGPIFLKSTGCHITFLAHDFVPLHALGSPQYYSFDYVR